MSILFDLLSYGAGIVSTVGVLKVKQLFTKKSSKYADDPPSMKWAYKWIRCSAYIDTDQDYGGFCCPACLQRRQNSKQPPLCECVEFPRDHFHFECKDCHYKAIMRTANDPTDQ